MARLRPTPSKVTEAIPACPIKVCLQFISGAWTAEILWYLRGGPRRFRDLQRDLGEVSAKVLSTRLKELEENEIIIRDVKDTKPPTVEYSITKFGMELMPVFTAVAEVGERLLKKKGGVTCKVKEEKRRRLG